MNRGFRFGLMASASAVVLTLPATAYAQTATTDASQSAPQQPAIGPQSGQAAESGIADIVVTANRIETSAQNTAVALNVHTGTELRDQGVTDLRQLQRIDPSLVINVGASTNIIAIRGVASQNTTEIGDPAVAVARDGFFTNRTFGFGTSFYDLQRVEVLKGPQGTLFGRNSSAGVINIITQKPTHEYGGYATVEVGNYDLVNAEAAVNLPVSDAIAFRVSGLTQTRDGYRRLTPIGGRSDDADQKSIRAQVAIDPFDGLHAWASYQHDSSDRTGEILALLPIVTTNANGTARTDNGVIDYGAAGVGRFSSSNSPPRQTITGNRFRWEVSYDRLPLGLTLTYAGGYDKSRLYNINDPYAPAFLYSNGPLTFAGREAPRTWNHEVRVATRQDQALTFQGGYYRFVEHNTIQTLVSGATPPALGPGLSVPPSTTPYLYDQYDYTTRTTSTGYFGQASYKFLDDRLTVTGGIRYTKDTKARNGVNVSRLASLPVSLYLPTNTITSAGRISESKPTYHAGVDYKVSSRNLLYAKFDTGYKSGGFISQPGCPQADYSQETMEAYEVGSKNRFNGGRVVANIDAFHQIYRDYQASQATGFGGCALPSIVNVPKALIDGVEGQFVAKLTNALSVDTNMTYLNARFAKNLPTIGSPASDISGNRLPFSPRYSVTGGIEYALGLGDGASLTARVDGKYSAATQYSIYNLSYTRAPSFATGNVTLTYRDPSERFQLQAFVRNFTNELVVAGVSESPSRAGFANVYFQAPRVYGAKFGFNF